SSSRAGVSLSTQNSVVTSSLSRHSSSKEATSRTTSLTLSKLTSTSYNSLQSHVVTDLFNNTAAPATVTTDTVVYVVNATTLLTTASSIWANSSVSVSLGSNSTVAPSWNTSAAFTGLANTTTTLSGNTTITPKPGGATSSAPFGNSTIAPSWNTSAVVTATLGNVTSSPNSSAALTSAPFGNSTALPSWNSSVAITVWPVNATTSLKPNATTASPPFSNTTSGQWFNASTTTPLLLNTTRPIWLNTSTPTLAPNTTTGRWLNTTAVPTIQANTTSVRWPNATVLANATTTLRWMNTTSASTANPTPTLDASCGETATPFALQVSQPDGKFDGWFLSLVGSGVLFTSVRSSASAFSVEASGHLCVVGHLDRDKRPYIAAVETREPSSSVWLLQPRSLDSLNGGYAAVKCMNEGGSLSCTANTTEAASHWLGCGLQLDLSTDGGGTVPVRGLNCTSIDLRAV
ncbi:hypothetical protein B0T25DRAFT_173385, partial [Lasiosphaeria hispida]